MQDPSRPVARRSLEAIFRHALVPDEPLKAQLRAAGFDPDRPEPSYSIATHKECLDIARKKLFPAEPEAEGFRKLGHVWIGGFAKNAVGTVLAAAARLMGTERVLARIPGYMKVGRSDFDVDIEALAPKHWRLRAVDAYRPMPHLAAGCVEAILELAGTRRYTVEVTNVDGPRFELDIRWS